MNERPMDDFGRRAEPEPPAKPEKLLGRRIVAGLIDLMVVLVIGMVFAGLFGQFEMTESTFEMSLDGWPFIFFVVASLGYYFVTEATTRRTLGKKIAGIRVAALRGELTAGRVLLRTVARVVDGFGFYLVAVILIAVTPNSQRLGDLIGGTIVERALPPEPEREPW